MAQSQVQQRRVLINALPSGGTELLVKLIKIFNYESYATSSSYLNGTPRSLNYREVKQALVQTNNLQSPASSETVGLGGLSPLAVNLTTLRYWLDRIPDRQFLTGHCLCCEALNFTLTQLAYSHLFILRDPRAVIANLLPFILDNTRSNQHFLEADFRTMTPNQQLSFLLDGGYAFKAGVEIKPFAEVYCKMLAWCNQPDCLVIRYEDLVGEPGGGSVERQMDAIQLIAATLDIPLDQAMLAQLQQMTHPTQSSKISHIEAWRRQLSGETIEYLIEHCKSLCQQAGYEV